MGYRTLITKTVDKAFSLAKDLLTDVVLVQKRPTGYDFNNAEATATQPVTTEVKCLVVTEKQPQGSKDPLGLLTSELIIRSSQISDPTVFDKVTIDGVEWAITSVGLSDAYITRFTISKRA